MVARRIGVLVLATCAACSGEPDLSDAAIDVEGDAQLFDSGPALSDASAVIDASGAAFQDATPLGDASVRDVSSVDTETVRQELQPILPTFDGECPVFQNETWNEFIWPDGTVTRAWLWYDEDIPGPRPFGFYMAPHLAENYPYPAEPPPHGTMDGSFRAAGGVVVLVGPPDRTPAFETIDAVVACASEGLNLDPRRIHAWGLSRGASMTVSFGAERANYAASIAVFSSNRNGTEMDSQRPENRYSLLTAYGDEARDRQWRTRTIELRDNRRSAGHPVVDCDHGAGHWYPNETRAMLPRFLLDHPFGLERSPYEDERPAAVPEYCHASR